MAVDDFPLVDDQKVFAAKIETTTGTAEVLTASEAAFNIYNVEMTDETEMDRREGESTSSSQTSIAKAFKGRCTFETDLVGDGAAGVPLWATTFLPPCGMVAASGQSYTFVTGALNAKTLTMAVYEDGLRRMLTGAAGTWTINLKSGEQGRIKFEFVGKYQAEADIAMLAPTYPTVLPPRFANTGAATWGAYSLLLSTAEIAAKNTLYLRESPSETDLSGYRCAMVTHREPMATIDPEAVLVAAKGWHAAFRASTEAALTFVIGATNNKVTIAGPKAQVSKRGRGQREKMLTDAIEMYYNRNTSAGDNELSITFA